MPTWRSTTSISSRPIPTPPRRSWIFGTWRCRGARRKPPRLAYSDAQAKQLTESPRPCSRSSSRPIPIGRKPSRRRPAGRKQRAMEGQYHVLRATYVSDKAEKAKLLADARKIFEEIRPQFEKAMEGFGQTGELAAGRRHAPTEARRGRNHGGRKPFDRGHGRFLPGPNPGGRPATHRRPDQVDQGVRRHLPGLPRGSGMPGLPGMAGPLLARREFSRNWARFNEAKDIYEEVVACDERNIEEVDESKQAGRARALRKTGMEGFFADVEQYYLQTLYQLNKKDYLEEVETWRAVHKANSERCYGYQALTLEYARNLLEIAEQSKEEAKKEGQAKALALLGEMAKIPSPYQQDAIKLRRELNPKATAEEGFEDAVIDGDAAVGEEEMGRGRRVLRKGHCGQDHEDRQERLAAVENTLVACYHNLAMQLYQQGKIEEAIATAKKALKPEFLQTKAAPGVAVFLLNVQYYQYLGAAERHRSGEKGQGRTAHQGRQDRQVDPSQGLGRQGRGRRRADRAAPPGPGPGRHGRGRQGLERDQPQLEGVSQGLDGDGFRALVQVQDGQEAA